MKSRSAFAVIWALIFTIILAGCGASAPKATSAPSPTKVESTTVSPTDSAMSEAAASDDPAASAKGYFDALYNGDPVDQFVCNSPDASISTLTNFSDSAKVALEISGAKFDVSGFKYETANQSGDTADVSVSGKYITVSAAGTSTTADFPTLTLTMKNEGGWKICGLTTP
ncbi:MAG: hypothetical protein ABI690_34950 [Chloroflexota bacterium]